MRLAAALAILLATPALVSAADDQAAPPRDARAWYRIQPSHEAGGPFVAVSFHHGREGWSARRVIIVDEVRKTDWPSRAGFQTTTQARCPVLPDLIASLEPALDTGVDVDWWKDARPPSMHADGWSITVGARGRLAGENALGSIAVDSNFDGRAGAWAIAAEKALAACWGPVSELP
ncbi:MAG: hypothetical protein Q7T61_10135 [Caulobacter sp.]|nr:hypothetical protein [Caulobacter sp.]